MIGHVSKNKGGRNYRKNDESKHSGAHQKFDNDVVEDDASKVSVWDGEENWKHAGESV